MDSLPADLLKEVLTKVPLKYLIRCRQACKNLKQSVDQLPAAFWNCLAYKLFEEEFYHGLDGLTVLKSKYLVRNWKFQGPCYRNGYGAMMITRWSAGTGGDRYQGFPVRVTRYIDCTKPNGVHKFCVRVHASRVYVGVADVSKLQDDTFDCPLTDDDEICDFKGSFQAPPKRIRLVPNDIVSQEKPSWYLPLCSALRDSCVYWYGYEGGAIVNRFGEESPVSDFSGGDRIGFEIETDQRNLRFYKNGKFEFTQHLPPGKYVPFVAGVCGEYGFDPSVGGDIVPLKLGLEDEQTYSKEDDWYPNEEEEAEEDEEEFDNESLEGELNQLALEEELN